MGWEKNAYVMVGTKNGIKRLSLSHLVEDGARIVAQWLRARGMCWKYPICPGFNSRRPQQLWRLSLSEC